MNLEPSLINILFLGKWCLKMKIVSGFLDFLIFEDFNEKINLFL